MAYPPQTGLTAQPVVEPLVLTPEEQAAVDALYEQLKPQATQAARDYVLARTPALYQEAMIAKIDADWPLPPAEDPAALSRADANPNADPNLPPYQAGQVVHDPRMQASQDVTYRPR